LVFKGISALGVLTLLLLSTSLWSIASIGADYSANKAKAVAAHGRCLANIEQQHQQTASQGAVWPCWHSQLAVRAYQKDWGLLTALAQAGGHQGSLYLATLAALLLWAWRR
jgi:hypothetical protein